MSKLHPLAIQICGQSIMQTDPIGVDDMDKIIRQYLQERAEWLKQQYTIPRSSTFACLINQAFGISADQFDLSTAEKSHQPVPPPVAVPEKKSTYEHREIKIGNSYHKETDARYNAGFNDAIDAIENLQRAGISPIQRLRGVERKR